MILICFGTRPEYIKLKPLMSAMDGVLEYKTLFTGQHKDLVKHKPDFSIEIEDDRNRLDSIISSTMNSIDFRGISCVIVQGDTTSVLAVALSAFNNKVPVVHLEAGLRTYNLEQPYPEEANRQLVSRISDLHLCPTENAATNLQSEGVPSQKIHVVGNTVLDNLVGVEVTDEHKILVTMHRRENHARIEDWFNAIDKLAGKNRAYEFCLPVHPNPAVKEKAKTLNNLKIVEPMPHEKLIKYLSSCSYVITDSGGIQEEAAFFRKPCLVCREETERYEGLDNFSLLCKKPEDLARLCSQLDNLQMKGECPYGDGNASKKIVEILNAHSYTG
jgi:UDP-N-acetylglucosamine 2-epimerase (non-hydrolysing)